MTEAEQKLVAKWALNKEKLGFACKVHTEGKKISIKLDKLSPCYEVSANKLCNQVVQAGIRHINATYRYYLPKQVEQSIIQAYQSEFENKIDFFLNTLVSRGYQAFARLVDEHAYVFGLRQKMQHLQFCQGKWLLDGESIDLSQLRKVL